jgi:Aspartyl/Asparaginyl beta-hydroxylase
MSRFLKVASGWDVTAARIAIQRQPHLWNQFTHRTETEGSPHREVDDIWVRYNAYENLAAGREAFSAPHESVWYPAWYALPELRPIVFGLMNLVAGEQLGGVLITKLKPHGSIPSHTDAGWHPENFRCKLYVTLNGAKGNLMWAGPEGDRDIIDMATGDVHVFDNVGVEHGVENHSDEDRITLICCIKTDDYIHRKMK